MAEQAEVDTTIVPPVDRDAAAILYPDTKKDDEAPGITEDPTVLDAAPETDTPDEAQAAEEKVEDPDPVTAEEDLEKESAEGDEKPDATASDEKSDTPDATTDDDSDEGETISSFAELVEHFNLDPDWVMGLAMSAKANGKELAPSLKDAVDSYQTIEAAEMRLADAKDKSKAMLDEASTTRQEAGAVMAELTELVKAAEKVFGLDANAERLESLRQDDPVGYLTAEKELEKRRAAVNELKQRGRSLYENTLAEQNSGMSDDEMAAEAAKLIDRIPSWKDQKVMQAESQEVIQYALSEYGVTSEEFANSDHRTIDMLRKSMLYDRGQEKVQQAKKRVVKVPVTKGSQTKTVDAPKKPRTQSEILYGS